MAHPRGGGRSVNIGFLAKVSYLMVFKSKHRPMTPSWLTAHTYVTDPDGPTAFVSRFPSTRFITLEQRT